MSPVGVNSVAHEIVAHVFGTLTGYLFVDFLTSRIVGPTVDVDIHVRILLHEIHDFSQLRGILLLIDGRIAALETDGRQRDDGLGLRRCDRLCFRLRRGNFHDALHHTVDIDGVSAELALRFRASRVVDFQLKGGAAYGFNKKFDGIGGDKNTNILSYLQANVIFKLGGRTKRDNILYAATPGVCRIVLGQRYFP